jgi:nitroreductase
MTSFLDLVETRQSVRQYDPRAVEAAKLGRCLEAARLAPSASNSQPWKFIVVNDPDLTRKVARETVGPLATFNTFASQAPALVVITIEKMKPVTQVGAYLKDREFSLIDIGIAAEHFCLQATDEGLGTCMLGWFKEEPIKQLLNIPKKKRIGLIITVGYSPNGYTYRKKTRQPFEEMVSYNKY